MNAGMTMEMWLGVFGLLFLEISLGLVLAGAAQRWIRMAGWRHAIWISSFLASFLWLLIGFTGLEKKLAATLTHRSAVERQVMVRTDLEPRLNFKTPAGEGAIRSERETVTDAFGTSGASKIVWPLWAWLAGSVILGLRLAGCKILLAGGWVRRCRTCSLEHSAFVAGLAARLGYRRRVRALECEGLCGPIAFGWIRPTVGLPIDFWSANSRNEQEAILMHELAHLRHGDPFWLMLADSVLVLLWWHPLLWWGRHQLRQSSEQAADEASVLTEEGPLALAGCLLALARQVQEQRSVHRLGMAGFRSGLGRRIERLLRLDSSQVRTCQIRNNTWRCLGASVVFVVFVLVGVAWILPQGVHGQPSLLSAFCEAMGPAVEADIPFEPAGDYAIAKAQEDLRVNPVVESPAEGPARISTPSGSGIKTNPPALSQPETPLPLLGNLMDDGISRNQDSPPGTNRLVTRIYKVDRGLMQVKLESAAGPVTAGTFVTNLLQHLKTAGVDFSPGQTHGRALYFSDSAGALFVRATLEDLDMIEKAIQFLSAQPPQIMIEARFVEVSSDSNLAPDFYVPAGLGQMEFTDAAGAANQEPKPAEMDSIHEPQELRGDELDWVGRSVTNAHNLRVDAVLGPVRKGYLTETQMRNVLRALEQRTGVDIMTAPRVTTLSGRQAQIQVCELKSVVTGINPKAVVQPGQPRVLGEPSLLTSAIPTGPTLDIVPQAAQDGFTIHITAIPSLVEFMGYDEAPRGEKISVWQDGRKKSIAPPLPRFRVRSMQAQAVLRSGETIVMESFPVAETVKVRGKSNTNTKRLLVFITATLVDPAGNPKIKAAPSPGG